MKIKYLLFTCLLMLMLIGCRSDTGKVFNPSSKETATFIDEIRYIREWNDLLYFQVKHLVVGPPEASRLYGYLGVTVYEACIGGMPDNNTLAGQLNGLKSLPRTDPRLEYDWPTVVIESLFQVCTDLLSFTLEDNDGTFVNLRSKQLAERQAIIKEEIYKRSLDYAVLLSEGIIEWAGKDQYLETRKLFYKTPSRTNYPEYWESTDINVRALEPHWNRLRPFLISEANICPATLLHPYSEDKNSEFYKQALAVYNSDKTLSEQHRKDALFWADCPGETATPPGHWTSIMGYVTQQQNLNLQQAAEMYALTGIGIADAFIQCWHTKYEFNLVRPKTYIREVLGHTEWEPFVITPPFPEYTSGHSLVSSCAAELLTHVMGDQIGFIDSTHLRIGLEVRQFKSFREASQQAVDSRLYGGMHYPMANEMGQQQGQCLAKQILGKIKLRNENN